MSVTRAQKATQLQELKEKFSGAQSVIFTHYLGLTVGDVTDLRKKLRENGAEMKVAKKTLMQIAARELNLPALEDSVLEGGIACVFSNKDPVAGAQVLQKFAKDHPQVAFMGGLFEGKILDKGAAKALASIPTRPVLLSMFAQLLRAPATKFAMLCNSPATSIARAINEVSAKGGFAPKAA